jgi:hypothetical protein
MLPKITDKLGLRELRKAYNVPTTLQIKKLADHWELFKSIAQNKNFEQQWRCSVLYFGKKWFEKNKSAKWNNFNNLLLRTTWEQTNRSLDNNKFNMTWGNFAKIISSRRLQPKPYLIAQIKHLLAIMAKKLPAFTVMDNSQESAPIESLQKIFVEVFGLKKYLPTIMHICMPNDDIINPRYVYYSLNIPTLLDGSPLKKTTSTIVNDLREINLILETLKNNSKLQKSLDGNLAVELDEIIKNTEIGCFHYKDDIQRQINSSEDIPIKDNTFIRDKNRFPSRTFCPTSTFFSGCVRIKT